MELGKDQYTLGPKTLFLWKESTPSCPLTSMYHAHKINIFLKVHKEAKGSDLFTIPFTARDHLLQDLEAKA